MRKAMSSTPEQPGERPFAGCRVPPEILNIGLGFDADADINRLLRLCREARVEPRRALELGCGGGRLVAPLAGRGLEMWGIELSPALADEARRRLVSVRPNVAGEHVITGDMTAFALPERYDLIYTSANTIRHVLADDTVVRMMGCIAQHLAPGGVFVADMELGVEHERARVGHPAQWEVACGEVCVHTTWEVCEAPTASHRRTRIRWTYLLRSADPPQRWTETFTLRAYEPAEFVALAARGGLRLAALYEPRDPYLLERPIEAVSGRTLVVLRAERS